MTLRRGAPTAMRFPWFGHLNAVLSDLGLTNYRLSIGFSPSPDTSNFADLEIDWEATLTAFRDKLPEHVLIAFRAGLIDEVEIPFP